MKAIFPSPPPRPRPVHQPSPVPWIADEVWTDWQYWKLDPLPPDFPTIEHPDLIVVTAEDRDRAPLAPIPPDAPLPRPGALEEHVCLLASTPPSVGIHSPIWPVCCDRLTTLVNHQGDGVPIDYLEAQTGSLDLAFLVEDLRRNWNCRSESELVEAMARGYGEILSFLREDGMAEGVAIYHCRSCGRVYVGGCHP